MYNQFQNYPSNYNNSKPQKLTERYSYTNQNKEITQNIFTPYYINQYIERENYSTRPNYQNPKYRKFKNFIKKKNRR